MERAIVVRGKLSDQRHIELAEPITELQGDVEIVVRAVPSALARQKQDIFDFIAHLPPGKRSKEDIDQQIQEERDSWGDR